MTEVSIPVDEFNPGQVLACVGLLEAADVLQFEAEGLFNWSSSPTKFVLRAHGPANPLETVLDFLVHAHIRALAPADSGLKDRFGIETLVAANDGAFCASGSIKDSVLPVVLSRADLPVLQLSHWADSGGGRDPFKLWGGAGGYSGAARTRYLQAATKTLWLEEQGAVLKSPFDVTAELSSGFRLDMRRDYVPLDIGFSVNEHSAMAIVGYPLVELLAAIGLEHARPQRKARLRYRYGIWSGFLPPSLARPIVGAQSQGFTERFFSMTLGEPNDYERSILSTREEAMQ